jgi:diadenosine tetraphosphate (Ap4A) HIT family hydrolase
VTIRARVAPSAEVDTRAFCQRCGPHNVRPRTAHSFQTVFHFHLHVIPRYAGDGWNINPKSKERERSLLDSDAQTIKEAIASTD